MSASPKSCQRAVFQNKLIGKVNERHVEAWRSIHSCESKHLWISCRKFSWLSFYAVEFFIKWRKVIGSIWTHCSLMFLLLYKARFFKSLDFLTQGSCSGIFIYTLFLALKDTLIWGHNFRGQRVKNKYTESTLLNKGFNVILLQLQILIAQFNVYPLCITIATVLLKLHIGRNSWVEQKRISFVIFVWCLWHSDKLRNDFYAK